MRLYASSNSPFSTRVSIAVQAKGLDIALPPLPEGGLRSAQFLALNPVGKIPVLDLGGGLTLPESTVILRYLEDRHPTPSLLPGDAEGRARMNTIVALVDTYVMDPVIRLFPHLGASRDPAVVSAEVARWEKGMALLGHWLRDPLPGVEAPASFVDCVVPPALHLSRRISLMLGLAEDPADAQPAVVAYRARAQAHPLVGPALAALTATQEAYDLKAGRPSLASRH